MQHFWLSWAANSYEPWRLMAGARALKHAINGEHQTLSNAQSSSVSLSLSLWLSHSTAIAYTPSYWPSSISQPVNHMNRFRLRFVFDSNQFVWHFWLFHPLPHHCNWPPSGLFSECFLFASFFIVVVLGLLYRFCAPFSKQQQENRAGQTLPSNRVACCIFKYGLK